MKDIIFASREGFLGGGSFIYMYIYIPPPPFSPGESKGKGIRQGEGI